MTCICTQVTLMFFSIVGQDHQCDLCPVTVEWLMICFSAGSSHSMLAAMQKSKGYLCELEPGLLAAAALSAAPPSAEPHAPMQTRFSAAALPAPVPCCTTDSVAAHLIINQSISQPIKSINLQSVNQSFYTSCFWDSSGESTDNH